jgi:hypothetical protein
MPKQLQQHMWAELPALQPCSHLQLHITLWAAAATAVALALRSPHAASVQCIQLRSCKFPAKKFFQNFQELPTMSFPPPCRKELHLPSKTAHSLALSPLFATNTAIDLHK